MMFSTLENLFNADYDFDVRTFFIGIPYPFDLKVPPFAMHTATLSFGSGSLRMGVVGLKWTKKILSAMTANCSEFKPQENKVKPQENKSKTKIKPVAAVGNAAKEQASAQLEAKMQESIDDKLSKKKESDEDDENDDDVKFFR